MLILFTILAVNDPPLGHTLIRVNAIDKLFHGRFYLKNQLAEGAIVEPVPQDFFASISQNEIDCPSQPDLKIREVMIFIGPELDHHWVIFQDRRISWILSCPNSPDEIWIFRMNGGTMIDILVLGRVPQKGPVAPSKSDRLVDFMVEDAVLDRLGQDNLDLKIKTIDEQIQCWQGQSYSILLDKEHANFLHLNELQVEAILAMVSSADKRFGFQMATDLGPHSRVDLQWRIELDLPEYSYLRRLQALMLLQSKSDFEGGHERAQKCLEAATQLTRFSMDNPSIIRLSTWIGMTANLNHAIQNHVPPGEYNSAMLTWFPSDRELRRALKQAIYLDLAKFHFQMLENSRLQDEDVPFDEAVFEQMNRELFIFLEAAVDQPLLDMAPLPTFYVRPSNTAFRKSLEGAILDQYLRIDDPSRNVFLAVMNLVAIAKAANDSSKVKIGLALRDLTQNPANIARVISEMKLINMFTGQPYRVNKSGLLEVLPPDSHLWQSFIHKGYTDGLMIQGPKELKRSF